MTPQLAEALSRQAVLLDRAADEVLRRVIELHAPVEQSNYAVEWWVTCEGCDEGPHAVGRPTWPCATIKLIAEQLHVILPWAP